MAQYWHGERADVVRGDMRTAMEQRARLGTEHERLPTARPGSPAYPFVDKLRRMRLPWTGGRREPDRKGDQLIRDGHLLHQRMKLLRQ